MQRLQDSIVNLIGTDALVKVKNVKKVEERLCYDAWWEFKTNLGDFTLKTYDGISERNMREICNNIKTLKELNDIQPKCFYYD